MNKSSILLVEDHAIFAKALQRILEEHQHLSIVAVAETAEIALKQLPELNVDLVLVDVSLPDMSGIGLVSALLQQYPNLRCVMLSGHLSPQYADRALEAGARGYLVKDNPAGILAGIQDVLDGKIYVSQEISDLHPREAD